jgi:hypothetical protein
MALQLRHAYPCIKAVLNISGNVVFNTFLTLKSDFKGQLRILFKINAKAECISR